MKKGMAFFTFCSVVFVFACLAENSESAADSDHIRTIQYTITVNRDNESFDAEMWDTLEQDARAIVSHGKKSSDQSPQEIIQLLTRSIEKFASGTKGIHGTISVALSEEDCVHKGCGGACDKPDDKDIQAAEAQS